MVASAVHFYIDTQTLSLAMKLLYHNLNPNPNPIFDTISA